MFLINTDNTFKFYFIIFIPPHILGLLLIILLHELFLDEFDDEGGQYMAEDDLDWLEFEPLLEYPQLELLEYPQFEPVE